MLCQDIVYSVQLFFVLIPEEFYMKKFMTVFRSVFMAAVLVFGCCGCEIIEEALEAGKLDTDNPNSDDYRPRFVVGIFSIVKYLLLDLWLQSVARKQGRITLANYKY